MFDRYTKGIYNSASEMLSAGFGAEPPTTTSDRWFTILNMIASAVFLALLVGNVTTVMTGLDSSGRMFKEKIDEVQQYILYKDLDASLKQRILNYFEFKYSKGKLFDEHKILSELNGPLRKQISMHNCKSLILKVPFFRDAGDAFISNVVTILKVNHFLPGDKVIEEDTSGDEMVSSFPLKWLPFKYMPVGVLFLSFGIAVKLKWMEPPHSHSFFSHFFRRHKT
jgi:hypothetical protein